jgi:hypothetical protein
LALRGVALGIAVGMLESNSCFICGGQIYRSLRLALLCAIAFAIA